MIVEIFPLTTDICIWRAMSRNCISSQVFHKRPIFNLSIMLQGLGNFNPHRNYVITYLKLWQGCGGSIDSKVNLTSECQEYSEFLALYLSFDFWTSPSFEYRFGFGLPWWRQKLWSIWVSSELSVSFTWHVVLGRWLSTFSWCVSRSQMHWVVLNCCPSLGVCHQDVWAVFVLERSLFSFVTSK